jgi:DNA-binding MarR family transcriptional regulator
MPDLVIDESPTIRPTKKQRALLEFIAQFISANGYSPCYREIMTGLGYTSVATVSLHVNSLIKRGHLQKRDHSARSLEVTSEGADKLPLTQQVKITDEKWLVDIIEARFAGIENNQLPDEREIDSLFVLVGALKVLGLEDAARSYMPRLKNVKNKK